jgi:flagellar basal body P-ring formation protein FlgA
MTRLILALLLTSAPLAAQTFEDIKALDAYVATSAPGAQPIDPRLKLARCPEAIIVDPPALGAVAVRCPALGWRIRVTLAAEAKAEVANVIRRGDPVDLVSSGNGFEVSTRAVALEDAAPGRPVRVKSLTTAAISVGIAIGPGNVSAGR